MTTRSPDAGPHPHRIRSLLFAPGNSARKLHRVTDFGADAVDLDLEDAVPVTQKLEARRMVGEALRELKEDQDDKAPLTVVRVNGPDSGLMDGDLEVAVQAGVFAIHLTKLRSPDDIEACDRIVTELEVKRHLSAGSVRFISSVDSAALALRLEQMAAASPRLYCFVLGGVDFADDLGVGYSESMSESFWVRSYGVLVSRAAGLAPPLHPPVTNFKDPDHLQRVMAAGRQLGFQGGVAIHPAQVSVLHQVFKPSAEEERWAKAVVAGFSQALADGTAAVGVGGELVDYAMVRRAEQILKAALGDDLR